LGAFLRVIEEHIVTGVSVVEFALAIGVATAAALAVGGAATGFQDMGSGTELAGEHLIGVAGRSVCRQTQRPSTNFTVGQLLEVPDVFFVREIAVGANFSNSVCHCCVA
jgi:hypothetical protein